MEYSPPPLFKQGASARVKVVVFALIAIALLVVDSRLRSLGAIRQAIGVVLYPLQVVALMPRDAARAVGGYFSSVSSLQEENAQLKQQKIANGQLLQQGQQLRAENAQLRRLLSASQRMPLKSVMSEILYDTRDVFTRKIVLDRGQTHGVQAGRPVIDDVGVVGQVTRVYPFTSEVTLLTDKDYAIAVQVIRSGLRSVAYGRGQAGLLELRYIAANADVQKGDVLVTSGIDGVYPAGLAVARVTSVEHKSGDAFARIVCQPIAGIDRHKQLLVLLDEEQTPVVPPADLAPAAASAATDQPSTKAGASVGGLAGQAAAPARPTVQPVVSAPAGSAVRTPGASIAPATPAAAPPSTVTKPQSTTNSTASAVRQLPAAPSAAPSASPAQTSTIATQGRSAVNSAGTTPDRTIAAPKPAQPPAATRPVSGPVSSAATSETSASASATQSQSSPAARPARPRPATPSAATASSSTATVPTNAASGAPASASSAPVRPRPNPDPASATNGAEQ